MPSNTKSFDSSHHVESPEGDSAEVRASGQQAGRAAANRKALKLLLHLALFAATAVTTTLVGLAMSDGFVHQTGLESSSKLRWAQGLSYSVSLMAILTAHEFGHYLSARRYGVEASLPYFIPMPTLFGTMGAFIRMRQSGPIKGDGFIRIAAYGPIAGFVVAVPVLFIGTALSGLGPAVTEAGTGISLGDSLIMLIAQALFIGDLPENTDLWLHPMAFAGWAGMFVTALNLLPVSQLDGGHIAYCLLGKRQNRVAPFIFVGMVAAALFSFSGWTAICVLVFFIGVQHPPACTHIPVTGRSRTIGLITLAIFVLTFIPTPFGGMPGLLELIFGQ
ncbi:MAG: site-2 protease family protein [Myxococcales bacterium]|nr:site-2 protease family protein [Myxococcales bacterium]